MPFFSRSIADLETADLAELLAEGAVENVRLEFKRDVPGPDETLKKLSGFANTFGGYLIVGAEASSFRAFLGRSLRQGGMGREARGRDRGQRRETQAVLGRSGIGEKAREARGSAGAAKPAAGTWAAKHDAELKANGWKVMGGRGP